VNVRPVRAFLRIATLRRSHLSALRLVSVLRVLCRCCLLAGALLVCDAGALRAQDTTDVPPPPPPLPEEAEPAPMPEPEPRETPPERPPPPPAPRPQPERPPRPQETPQAPPRTQPPPASATPAPQQEQAVGMGSNGRAAVSAGVAVSDD